MDEDQLPNTNIFRISKDANGNPVYLHNNVPVSKDVFDSRNQASIEQMNAMKNSTTPGLDDDADIAAMRQKAKAMFDARMAAKKGMQKAKGGSTSAKTKMSTHQKNPKHPNW